MTMTLNEGTKSKLIRWTTFLISPVAWTTYFMVVYAFDEMVCGLDVFRSTVWGSITAAGLIMILLTLVTLALTGVGIYLGRRIWVNSRQSKGDLSERDEFIGLSAMLISGLFVILTIGMGAAIVVLEPC